MQQKQYLEFFLNVIIEQKSTPWFSLHFTVKRPVHVFVGVVHYLVLLG